MQLTLLLAGLGERLRPLTILTPKPLLPIKNHKLTFLNIIDQVVKNTVIDKVYLIISYLAYPWVKEIEFCLKKYGISYELVIDDKLRGTFGQLKLIINKLPENDNLLLINADLYFTNLNFNEVCSFHKNLNCDITIVCKKYRLKFGIIETENYIFKKWVEKPEFKIVTGIYLLNTNVVKDFFNRFNIEFMDMNEFINKVSKDYRVCVYTIDQEVYDIGTLDDYVRVLKSCS